MLKDFLDNLKFGFSLLSVIISFFLALILFLLCIAYPFLSAKYVWWFHLLFAISLIVNSSFLNAMCKYMDRQER